MTDKDQIVLLRKALKNLMHSADAYISEGSYIETLCRDLKEAMDALRTTHPRLNKGEKQ